MILKKFLKKIMALSFAVFVVMPPIYATGSSFPNIKVVVSGGKLVLNTSLENGLSEEIIEAIKSGVPVSITYKVTLKTKRPLLFNKKIGSRIIKRSVEYDTLQEEYKLINDSDKQVTTKITDDLDEALTSMTTLKNIPLMETNKLNKEKKYFAEVKAQLNSERSWFPFDYILVFFPFLNFDTSWENSSSFSLK